MLRVPRGIVKVARAPLQMEYLTLPPYEPVSGPAYHGLVYRMPECDSWYALIRKVAPCLHALALPARSCERTRKV